MKPLSSEPLFEKKPPFDLLATGALAVDEQLFVDAYPPADQKVRVVERHQSCGGLAGTALVAAARLGARAGYIGTLGRNDLSEIVAEQFRREGIDFSSAVVRDDASPGRSTIIVDRQKKTRNVFSFVQGYFGPDPSLPEESVVRQTAVLLVDHHEIGPTVRMVRMARAAGIPVVADFERDPGDRFAELVELVDHLILPKAFALDWTGEASAPQAIGRLWTSDRAAVVITCGDEGCWYHDATTDEPVRFSAFPVDPVDTTGCGDVFHGAYCVGLAEGLDLAERIRLATATAALSATRRGTQDGIPRREEVERFLQGQSGC